MRQEPADRSLEPGKRAPIILSREALEGLNSCRLPGVTRSDIAALVRLHVAATAAAAGITPHFAQTMVPFNAGAAYGADRLKIPAEVRLERPVDLAIAREILQERGMDNRDDTRRLYAWKRAVVRRDREERLHLTPDGSRLSPLDSGSGKHRVLFVSMRISLHRYGRKA